MPEIGQKIDIVTGRPLFEDRERRRGDAEKAAEESLKERAAFLGAIRSEPGRAVLEVIKKRLSDRVEQIVGQDPEARCLLGLLREFGIKEDMAAIAADALYQKAIRMEGV